MTKMQFVNFCTKYSVAKWNKHSFLRRIFREIAQRIILHHIRHDTVLKLVIQTTKLQGGVNLYPWPYCVKNSKSGFAGASEYAFAPWSCCDDDTIVGDCFGNYVIRHSTSYCAALIYYATGKILSENRQHAKKWVATLAANGFSEVVKRPINGGYYIGVAPHIGQYGQLYWFEYVSEDCRDSLRYMCSTYENDEYQQCLIRADCKDIKWVKIA